MPSFSEKLNTRRKFLGMLAGSPLLASAGFIYGPLLKLLVSDSAETTHALRVLEDIQQGADLISSPEQAINVMDFEPVARKVLPLAHFGYLATGVDDDATVRLNHEAYSKIEIRSRRLVDVSKIDMSVPLFGTTWTSPIVIDPVGAQKAFHPEGEVAVAKAARSKQHLQILSNVATSSVEDVIAARGAPIWQQLYLSDVWEVSRATVKRAEAAGCPALVVTVDLQDASNRETLFRSKRLDSRKCSMCHADGFGGLVQRIPAYDNLDLSKATSLYAPNNTWDVVKHLRDLTTIKLVLKGIVTREDAQLAIEHGIDGLIVSNHGGRGEETLRPTIECLPEVLEGAAGKIPVLVDGGIRRGTDAFKALALGATAVGIGRPYIWGLASFGQAGVETVLEILRRELKTIMRQAGTVFIDKITRASVVEHFH
jgi:isopentenyl diphosphate isomerase/L-lactate dehydrogenase-like FMN-dependent dehydrogenase